MGATETGQLFEQEVAIADAGQILRKRRIVLKLFQPIRDRVWEIAILTNKPATEADAAQVASLYRGRLNWKLYFRR